MTVDRLIANIPSMSEVERRQMRDNAKRRLENGTAEQKRQAQGIIDALIAHESLKRTALIAHVQGLSGARRIVEAFEVHPMTQTDQQVAQALLDNPGATSAVLSDRLGWKGMSWHLHFGKMCELRKERLWPAVYEAKRNAHFYSGILAEYDDASHGFTMKPDAVEAFVALGLRPK